MNSNAPSPSSPPSLSRRTFIALLLLGFAGQLAWAVENQFYNTFLYDKITPNPQAVAWMVAITAVVSTLTAILMGTLSDRTRSRWGRRRPYIIGGYVLWGVLTAAFPAAALFQPVALGVFMAILFDSLMTYFGATANDAALSAYVADVTTPQNRGRVSGAMQIMTWIALLIVYGGAGLIIQALGYAFFFYAVGGLVFIIGFAVIPLLAEPPTIDKPAGSYWSQIASTFRLKNLVAQRDLFLLLISLTCFMAAFNVFFPYLMIYLQHFLRQPVMESSIIIAVSILVGGILLAVPIGMAVDRFGRRPVALLAVVCQSLGLVLFSFARSLPALVITGILWLAPYTAWVIATGAWTKDLYPEDKRGQFAGYYILFNVAFTMIPGPLLGGWLANTYGIATVIDGKQGMVPSPLIFQVAAGVVLLTLIPLLMTRKGMKREG
ncbi:MAG TPA: MFS transporter [Anaerolineaceae bacterium]